MSRDNAILWWVGIALGVIAYLLASPPPMEWGYYDWLRSVGVLLSTVAAKMSNSPLPGKPKE